MASIHLLRTHSAHPAFVELVRRLDADLAARDGEDHAFYAQFNGIAVIKHTVLAYQDGTAVGCGAIKEYQTGIMEVKRMYTPPEHRGKGIARKVLAELEAWARELGYAKCILETGKRQPEAVSLYANSGYTQIPNFGQYVGDENSVCFEKDIMRW